MKKLGIILLTLAALTLAPQNCFSEENANADQKPKIRKRAAETKEGQERMQQMRQGHQQLVDQLKKIRETAMEENAEKTVAQLDALIGQMEERAAQMEQMRQEREKMQRGEGRRERPTDPNSNQ